MTNEELAKKYHRSKTGAEFYKAQYWKGEWYRLTGCFGFMKGGNCVAQSISTSGVYMWNDEEGNPLIEGTLIRAMWMEMVNGVTNVPWR